MASKIQAHRNALAPELNKLTSLDREIASLKQPSAVEKATATFSSKNAENTKAQGYSCLTSLFFVASGTIILAVLAPFAIISTKSCLGNEDHSALLWAIYGVILTALGGPAYWNLLKSIYYYFFYQTHDPIDPEKQDDWSQRPLRNPTSIGTGLSSEQTRSSAAATSVYQPTSSPSKKDSCVSPKTPPPLRIRSSLYPQAPSWSNAPISAVRERTMLDVHIDHSPLGFTTHAVAGPSSQPTNRPPRPTLRIPEAAYRRPEMTYDGSRSAAKEHLSSPYKGALGFPFAPRRRPSSPSLKGQDGATVSVKLGGKGKERATDAATGVKVARRHSAAGEPPKRKSGLARRGSEPTVWAVPDEESVLRVRSQLAERDDSEVVQRTDASSSQVRMTVPAKETGVLRESSSSLYDSRDAAAAARWRPKSVQEIVQALRMRLRDSDMST